MARITKWERHIGRRLRLRDLFVFFTVVDCGSMAKAGAQLGVSTPSISDIVADLEHTLGIRLLDRTPKGVVPTRYGQALLARSHAAFDELRQGIRDIDFISDPAAGEIRIGCSESLLAFLGEVIERLARQHPRMRFHVQQVHWPTVTFPELHQRQIDLAFARLVTLPVRERLDDELDAEVLFDDPFSAVVAADSKWARRRKLDLADLAAEAWLSTPLDSPAVSVQLPSQITWLQTLFVAIGSAFHTVPSLWVHAGIAVLALMYVALFGIGASAYRMVRAAH